MTEYALAPARNWDTANSPYRTPRVMLEAGQLTAYRVRSNGTMRHLELYPLGSTVRETAEWISDAVEMDGRSVAAVARELHVSTPTIRRYLEGLELTEEIEQGDWDGLSFDSAGNPVFDTAWSEEDATESACTCAAEVLDQAVHEPTCALYVPVAPVPTQRPTTRRTRTPRTAKEISESAGVRWPSDEERAAALAGVTPKATQAVEVPGGQCEPEGTTADELAATLEASVAQANGGWDMIAKGARGAAQVACYCNELGGHRPGGLPGCKHTAPAPVRRPRSH